MNLFIYYYFLFFYHSVVASEVVLSTNNATLGDSGYGEDLNASASSEVDGVGSVHAESKLFNSTVAYRFSNQK